ncbi:PTS ascorbate-specific subunit IIBC [Actinobacillus equuli]|nr:PTS ascorbate-specific subunit IIBC [Actinobacillus equuli]
MANDHISVLGVQNMLNPNTFGEELLALIKNINNPQGHLPRREVVTSI